MYKKQVLLSVLIYLVVLSVCRAEVISDKQGIHVDVSDIDNLLKPAPERAQLGLLKSKERFTQKIEEIYLTKAIAEEEKKTPLTEDEQRTFDDMIATFHFQRKIKQLTTESLPDFEPLAKLYYEAHNAEYINPEMVAVEHILIDFAKHNENEALKIAKDVLAQLKKGADFAQLAEKYSDDPYAKNNHGKLGLFAKGQMVKEFEEAAYSLKVNELSNPVKTQFGYHILRKNDHKEASPKTFADMKDELVSKVKNEYIQTRLDEFYEKVKKDAEMKVDAQAVEAYIADKTKQLEAKMQLPSAVPTK